MYPQLGGQRLAFVGPFERPGHGAIVVLDERQHFGKSAADVKLPRRSNLRSNACTPLSSSVDRIRCPCLVRARAWRYKVLMSSTLSSSRSADLDIDLPDVSRPNLPMPYCEDGQPVV